MHVCPDALCAFAVITMGKITRGLESITKMGKSLSKVLKSKAVIAGMAAALPFMAANYAEAVDKIKIDYCVNTVGAGGYTLGHGDGALEGAGDGFDGFFYPMYCPDCEVDAKAVSHIEGRELVIDVRPLDSETSATVYCSMISKSGEPIVVDNAKDYLYIEYVSGFEGYDVFVNGENAREISNIDFGTLTGSYGSGETIRTVEITFEKIQEQEHAPEVETLYLPSGNIHETSATLEGRVIDDGSENCEWEFSYWPISNPGDITSTSLECCKSSGETFSKTVYGLSPGADYFFIAKAKNSMGLVEGSAISFTTLKGTEPNEPPNTSGNPIAGTWGTNTLFTVNEVGGYPADANGAFALTLAGGASDTLDANDLKYSRTATGSDYSKIVSEIRGPGRVERHELTVDARPPASRSDVKIRLSVESVGGEDVYFPRATENKLLFSFPKGTANNFSGMPLTIQRYVPTDPNARYPVWDIRKIMEVHKGELRLEDLSGQYDSGVPYSYWTISTTRRPGDVDKSGTVDANDYRIVWDLQGLEGPTAADVGGSQALGLPDGKVDAWDLWRLYDQLGEEEKAKVIPPPEIPYMVEDFETGDFGPIWGFFGTDWQVVSEDAHSGRYCAKANSIGDNEGTRLTFQAECGDGQISFWVNVSSQKWGDSLRFSIDNKEQAAFSGQGSWEEVSFPISEGTHLFTWEYEKNPTYSDGQDTAWIDDIRFPAK
jgi:hypothetical protein